MDGTPNDRTLLAYENGLEEYGAAAIPTVTGSVKEWVDVSLSNLPPQANILEIGSAHGRDADYIESQGFAIERTDAAQSFVSYMQSKGNSARLLNALTDDYGGPYDMVYANAVLLHFTPEECDVVLKRVRKALTPNGLFAFSVKIGEGSAWSDRKLNDPRFFVYWQEETLKKLLTNQDYDVVYWAEGQTGHDNGEWYHVIARVEAK